MYHKLGVDNFFWIFLPLRFSPLKRLNKKVRIGKFPKRVKNKKKGENVPDIPSGSSSDEEEPIDPVMVKAVLESYLSSEKRKKVLKDPWSNETEVGPFLALECLIRGQGVSNSIQLHFPKLSLLIDQHQCASVGYFDHTPCVCKEYKPCFFYISGTPWHCSQSSGAQHWPCPPDDHTMS